MTDHPRQSSMSSRGLALPTVGGIWLVILGAAMWGTDGLFRLPLTEEVSSTTIVFAEHLFLVAVTIPWLVPAVRKLKHLQLGEWLALLFIGVGASAVATTLFTLAFLEGDPVTPLVLQKLQPIMAAVAAALLLGERLRPRYGVFFIIALLSVWLLALPDPTEVTISSVNAALLSISAAALWGSGTVAGRYVASRGTLLPNDLTALRFAIGLPASFAMVLLTGDDVMPPADAWPTVIGLALVPGLLGLSLYYRGLRTTPAARATIGELAFPLTAAIIGVTVLDDPRTWSQWLGMVLLLVTVVAYAQHERHGARPSVEATVRSNGS